MSLTKKLWASIFHCFNISKHISISVLFFITSVSFFCVFCWSFENSCPEKGSLLNFSVPSRVGISHFLCSREMGIGPFKKNFPCGLQGGMVRLGND